MPYIRRDAAGVIESLHRNASDAPEFLPEQHPEVRAFLAIDAAGAQEATSAAARPARATVAGEAGEQFAALDADFVRVIEDVIDTLIAKNVINITDLPLGAQTKLFSRKSFRERANRGALQLFGGEVGERPL
ncbi:MAG TPA: hypothetical protein VH328_13390 [Burkholderiaceae bacterium]|jgi:hypothetical protein|nr:hypothetical protein [Burkholderiaceae bacterium]